MKTKKITRNELKQGMLIAVAEHEEATVYILGEQHPETGFVWRLYRYERGEICSYGWADYGCFIHPTKLQLKSTHNAPMIARYKAVQKLLETT
jgi:hypothetical protein